MTAPDVAQATPRAQVNGNTIELRNVSRWYGNVVAVNDITMTIGPGVTGLLGPNGAGKSTVLHMIAGFLSPTSTKPSAWCPSATRSTRS
jgi:ABC-2 type transport system ATP-binding protein